MQRRENRAVGETDKSSQHCTAGSSLVQGLGRRGVQQSVLEKATLEMNLEGGIDVY